MIDTIKENFQRNQIEIQEELSSKIRSAKYLEKNLEASESCQQTHDLSTTQNQLQQYDKQIELQVPFQKKEKIEIQKINPNKIDIQDHKIYQQQIQSLSILNSNNYNQSDVNPSRMLNNHSKMIQNKQYHHLFENAQPEILSQTQEIRGRYSRYQFQPQFHPDEQQINSNLNENKNSSNNQIIIMPNQNTKNNKIPNDINYTPKQLEFKGLDVENNNKQIKNQNQLNQPYFDNDARNILQKPYFNKYTNQYERIGIEPSNDLFNQNYMAQTQINPQDYLIHTKHQPLEFNFDQILILLNQDYEKLKNTLEQQKAFLVLKQKIRLELVTLIQKENNNLRAQKERCQQLLQCIQDCLDLEQSKREIQSQLFVNLEEQDEIKRKIQEQLKQSTAFKATNQSEKKANYPEPSIQMEQNTSASLAKPFQHENIKLEYDAPQKLDKSLAIILGAEVCQTNSDYNESQFLKIGKKQGNQNPDDSQLKSTQTINQIDKSSNNYELQQQDGILIKKEIDNNDHPIILNNSQYELNQDQYENALESKIKYGQQFENRLQQNYLNKIINPQKSFAPSALNIISQQQSQIHRPPPPYQLNQTQYIYQSQQLHNHDSLFQVQKQINQIVDPLQSIVKEEHNPTTFMQIAEIGEAIEFQEESIMSEENLNDSNDNNQIIDQDKNQQKQSIQVQENQIKIEQADNLGNQQQQDNSHYAINQKNMYPISRTSQFKETNRYGHKVKKQIEKKVKKQSDTKDLIRFRSGQEKNIEQIQPISYQQLSESELQKKLQFHNQLKIFMLQSSKYIKEQISQQIKSCENEVEKENYGQHIKYLDAFKNRFTKSDLSHFLKEIDEISFEEIEENMKEQDQKLKLIRQRKITYIITIIRSFTSLEQFKLIFPEENNQIFEQNSTFLSEYLLSSPQKIQEINQYIGKINYFNKMNRMYIQKYCLFQLGITACKKKASKLDQLYIKNYVLQMISNPSNIE